MCMAILRGDQVAAAVQPGGTRGSRDGRGPHVRVDSRGVLGAQAGRAVLESEQVARGDLVARRSRTCVRSEPSCDHRIAALPERDPGQVADRVHGNPAGRPSRPGRTGRRRWPRRPAHRRRNAGVASRASGCRPERPKRSVPSASRNRVGPNPNVMVRFAGSSPIASPVSSGRCVVVAAQRPDRTRTEALRHPRGGRPSSPAAGPIRSSRVADASRSNAAKCSRSCRRGGDAGLPGPVEGEPTCRRCPASRGSLLPVLSRPSLPRTGQRHRGTRSRRGRSGRAGTAPDAVTTAPRRPSSTVARTGRSPRRRAP